MEEHRKKCVNYEELCEKCESVFKPNETEKKGAGPQHDCIEVLKKRHERAQQEENALRW